MIHIPTVDVSNTPSLDWITHLIIFRSINFSVAEVDGQGGGAEEGQDTQVKGNLCGGF